ncbi:coenzyme F420 hydrogenase/dehydrogenase beta subunit N-terminal domain-containing protein [Methanobacterium bryantii]
MVQIGDKFYSNAVNHMIAEKGESGGSLTALYKFLLEECIVDAVLAVKSGADIYDAVPVLIDNPEDVVESAGALHCGTLNLAVILEKYLGGAFDIKIAVTTKPCDAMAINELIKRGRIARKNIIMLGINCGGGGEFAPGSHYKNVRKP